MIVCPSCGERSPDEFRFCPACATALSDAAPQESRKTVTIVFSDLVGSTALGERLDPEALREVLDRYFDEMRTALERHGGTVEKYIGDAVMAVFGLPRAHEDDALRAVRAAWDMRGALTALNDELQARWGATLHNRTGVSTGEVVAGDTATAQRLVTGDTVNTAARLEQAAPTDEILIGEPTFRLVKGVVRVEDVDPLALKGKAAEVIAFRLVGVDPVPREMVGANPLVGRSEELASLRGTLARVATDRRCELVTIVGEPGIGKSRLVAEFLDEAATTARVLSGRCLPYGESITFWPLAEVVRDAAGISEADSAEEAKALLAAIGGGLERADQVLGAVGSAIGLTSAAIPMQEIFWATRRLFEHLARERPLVVALDDLQWAEPTFLELVTEVVRLSEHAPLLIIGQARPELLEDHPEWAASAPSTTIFLDALTESEARELATSAIGDAGLPEELVDRLVTAADGNPLFVEQRLSMWVDDGLLRSTSSGWVLEAEPGALPVPDTISALLSARLDRLPVQEREVMERGSITGQVFYRGAVVEMTPTSSRSGVDDDLSALARRRLVTPDEATFAGEAAYRFGHLLIRDAAYSGMLKRARADLHERFAGWLERMAGDRLSEYREIVGYHLEQSYRYLSDLGPIDQHGRDVGLRAAAHLGVAAETAATRADRSATIELLDRAIEIVPLDEELSGDLIVDLSVALLFAGELDRMAVCDCAGCEPSKGPGQPAAPNACAAAGNRAGAGEGAVPVPA